MEGETVAALIAAAASIGGALHSVRSTKKLEAMRGEIAKDLAQTETALRLATERKLEIFRLAAASAESASRALHDWEAGMNAYEGAIMRDDRDEIAPACSYRPS